ncbi:aspartic peptidase domain-containing protein [Circinella umbellata]|nr:aspartic peptidase domain-containing protein [Circinella umbellata]
MRSLSLIAAIALVGSTVSAAPRQVNKTTNNNNGVLHSINMAYVDGQYILPINVGTPGQGPINVILDTGSDLSWVPGPGACEDCIAEYEPCSSSTAIKDGDEPVYVDYGDGQCATVDKYKDVLSLHGADDLKFQSFPVGAASSIAGFEPGSTVGYFGLGNPDALDAIRCAVEVETNVFEGKKKRQVNNGSGDIGSRRRPPRRGHRIAERWDDVESAVLTIGIDHTAYRGELYYFNLPVSASDCENRSIFWRTSLTSVSLKEEHTCKLLSKSFAKFATGTRAISGPPVHTDMLHKKFGAEYNPSENRYEFLCSKLDSIPELEFTFDTYQINLPAKVWTAQIDPSDTSRTCMCYTHIQRASDESKEWTLGTIVLDEFYQAWEQSSLRVGLGYLVDGSDNGATITSI